MIDVKQPTNCVRVGGYDTSGWRGVAVIGGRIYVADGKRAWWCCHVPNVYFTVRVDATPNETFTLQGRHQPGSPILGNLLTTNVPHALRLRGLRRE